MRAESLELLQFFHCSSLFFFFLQFSLSLLFFCEDLKIFSQLGKRLGFWGKVRIGNKGLGFLFMDWLGISVEGRASAFSDLEI